MNDAASDARRCEAGLEIPLSEIPAGTKDFLLAMSATGKPVTEAIVETLEAAAGAAGFTSPRAA